MRSRSFDSLDIDRIPKQTGALQNLKSLSLFIHARVFHQYRNIHLKKNLSPSFPGSFSVKVNTVYALVLSTMYKWSSLIPMVNYPTNEMALTKIIRLDRNDLSIFHKSSRQDRFEIYFELFRYAYSHFHFFLS